MQFGFDTWGRARAWRSCNPCPAAAAGRSPSLITMDPYISMIRGQCPGADGCYRVAWQCAKGTAVNAVADESVQRVWDRDPSKFARFGNGFEQDWFAMPAGVLVPLSGLGGQLGKSWNHEYWDGKKSEEWAPHFCEISQGWNSFSHKGSFSASVSKPRAIRTRIQVQLRRRGPRAAAWPGDEPDSSGSP